MTDDQKVQKVVEDVISEAEKEVEKVVKASVREVETVVVEEVLTWFQKLKSWMPTWCYRPHPTEIPVLAKQEDSLNTHTE